MKKIGQMIYLAWWFFRARFFGRRAPLQTVLFISDLCNLECRHCSVYNKVNPHVSTYAKIKEQLEYAYSLGSRFVDFEGGEVTIWRDGDYRINDLIDLAREIGFFSATITTNAQLPFAGNHTDSIWVSLDGYGRFHEEVRGKGTFARLEKNIAECGHPHLSVNMVVNTLNYTSVEETIRYAAENPAIEMIAINFYTPFPGAEELTLAPELQARIVDKVIEMKKAGYPIMNSISGLKYMKRIKDGKFTPRCWVTNFIYADGSMGLCKGQELGICSRCGFCMAGEMSALFSFRPDTILSGLKLRM